ncbi:hypothetical protein B0H12DRAFT_1114727 [Mycena haematopus]|nr:hypothetical protein B0H12DRAFT_1114727 [Mycena haematopus]
MRLARSFSSSTCRARQAFFQDGPKGLSSKDKHFLVARKRCALYVNGWIFRDSKVIRSVFHCQANELDELRSECARRIGAALSKLQDPASFQVKDLTFNKLMSVPTINYPPELALIDVHNLFGIPPDTPIDATPPIHDPSLVAKALSDAGFTGAFLHHVRFGDTRNPLSHTEKRPWPNYKHVPYGAYIYPPRLHIDVDLKLGGSVTLTLPGATVQPLYTFFQWFHKTNPEFQTINELVTVWARSHNISLSPQAIALMVISAMQSDGAPFPDVPFTGGWSDAEYRRDTMTKWSRIVAPVDIDFTPVLSLAPATIPIQLAHFFRHWRDRLPESRLFAFSVRKGRENQLIPREYVPAKFEASGYRFLKRNLDDPAKDFPPWRHDRLVIQDPFLVTYNHTASLSSSAVAEFQGQIHRTSRSLLEGRPLATVYGTHAAPPGSDAEAKILVDPQAYSAALSLLERDRIPVAYRTEAVPVVDGSPEIRSPNSPDSEGATWNSRRWFRTSCVSLGKEKPVPMTPPAPISYKEQDPAEDREAWGLNSPVHRPSFWRPAPSREPLTLPKNASPSHPLLLPSPETEVNSVPPVRATRAGIAYKNASSKPQEPRSFHTTAHCAARRASGASAPEPINRIIEASDLSLQRSVRASRKQTLFAVQNAIQSAFGREYTVELFGSTRYGISSPKSDLDMVILDPHHPYGGAPGYQWDVRKMPPIYDVRKVAKKLQRAGFHIFETITGATVPIVKFADNSTGHYVDLNVNDRLGVLNSDLIKRYCQLNPVLAPMIQYIKLWAKPLGLNSPSGFKDKPVTFSSYALVMMTIAFLQHRGLLPNLQEGLPPLEPGKLKGTFWLRKPKIMCCDVRYNMAEGWIPPEDVPVHQLIQDWFNFWGRDFNYDKEMISIRQGGRLARAPRGSEDEGPFNGVLWNIDPFIRSKNITGNVARGSLTRFVYECRDCASRKEFEEGILPRPKGSARDEQPDALDVLMLPAKMRNAKWILVEDGIPLICPRGKTFWPPVQDRSDGHEFANKDTLEGETSLPAMSDSPPPNRSFPVLGPSLDHAVMVSLKPMAKDTAIKKKLAVIKNAQWLSVVEDELPFAWHVTSEKSTQSDNDEAETPKDPADENVLERGPPRRPSPPDIPDTNGSPIPAPSTASQVFDYDPALRFDKFGRSMAPEPPPAPPEPEKDQVGFGLRSSNEQ